jgi:hypothetical protein
MTMRGGAISTTRIITEDLVRAEPRLRPARERRAAAPEESELSTRPATPADIPWVQAWASQLGLPASESRRARSFLLLRGTQRIGFFAVREEMTNSGAGREPILWIMSAFLIPSMRGQGLLPKFGEILSRQHYSEGKVGCRVATDNTRMLRLLSRGGWKKTHATSRYVAYQLELTGPFKASHRR